MWPKDIEAVLFDFKRMIKVKEKRFRNSLSCLKFRTYKPALSSSKFIKMQRNTNVTGHKTQPRITPQFQRNVTGVDQHRNVSDKVVKYVRMISSILEKNTGFV